MKREIKKTFTVLLHSSCLGESTAQCEGPHGEGPGLATRQGNGEKVLLLWLLQEGLGKARQAGFCLANIHSVNNFSRLWGLRAALGCLVYDFGAIKAGLKYEILIKEEVRVLKWTLNRNN